MGQAPSAPRCHQWLSGVTIVPPEVNASNQNRQEVKSYNKNGPGARYFLRKVSLAPVVVGGSLYWASMSLGLDSGKGIMMDQSDYWWAVVAGRQRTIGMSGDILASYRTRQEAQDAIELRRSGTVSVDGYRMSWARIVDLRPIVGDPPRWWIIEVGREEHGVTETEWVGPYESEADAVAIAGDQGGPVVSEDGRTWDWSMVTNLERVVRPWMFDDSGELLQEDDQ